MDCQYFVWGAAPILETVMSRYHCHSPFLMFWGLLRNSFFKTTIAMMLVQEVEVVVVCVVHGAVLWWYDTGGCYNDTISRVLPIFVWLTARAALQPFVAVMQTPVTRDQTISSNTLISLQYTCTVIEIKIELKQYFTFHFYYIFTYLTSKASINQR